MKIERTHDMQVVRGILMHPRILPHIHEDGMVEINPVDVDAIYWLLVIDEDEPAGVFMVHPHNQSCYEMHTSLLPRIWGQKASESAQLLLRYLFQVIECKKIITNVPANNKKALRFALANGMKIEGVNRESYFKNGALIDQTMLGITRKEWLCQ